MCIGIYATTQNIMRRHIIAGISHNPLIYSGKMRDLGYKGVFTHKKVYTIKNEQTKNNWNKGKNNWIMKSPLQKTTIHNLKIT